MKCSILALFVGLVLTAGLPAYDRITPTKTFRMEIDREVISFMDGTTGGSLSPMALIHRGDSTFWTIDTRSEWLVEIELPSKASRIVRLQDELKEFGWSRWIEPWGDDTVLGSAFAAFLTIWDTEDPGSAIVYREATLFGQDENRKRATGGRGDYIIVAETLFYRDSGRKVRAISPEGELLSHEKALELMDTVAGDPEDTYAELDPIISERNRALRETGQHYVIGGRYYTTAWDELKEYLNSIERARDWSEAEDLLSYWEIRNSRPLLGYDQYYNSYWGIGPSMRVFSPTGRTLGAFSLVELVRESDNALLPTGWTMGPDGTVWALAFTLDWSTRNGVLYLYRFDSIALSDSE